MDTDARGSNLLLSAATELLQSKDLRDNDEAMCELLQTLANPQPEPSSWSQYGDELSERGLLELIYSVLRSSCPERPRVTAHAANALATLSARHDTLRASVFALEKLSDFFVDATQKLREKTETMGSVLQLLHEVADAVGWQSKELMAQLISNLLSLLEGGFVYCEDDKALVGPMWRLTWAVLNTLIAKNVGYNFREASNDAQWTLRVLAIIEKNYKHWECFYALTFFAEPMGHQVLRDNCDRAVKVIVKLLGWHAKGGAVCESKLCSEKFYSGGDDEQQKKATQERKRSSRKRTVERDADWGNTLHLGVDILTSLLLTHEQDENVAVRRMQALLPAALEKIDKYLVPNPSIDLAAAHGATDKKMVECFNQNRVVGVIVELLSSHRHYRGFISKLAHVLIFLTYENPDFRVDELFLGGKGPTALLRALEDDLKSGSVIENTEAHFTRFVAPLIILARKQEYKDALLAAGWETYVKLFDAAFELGLQICIYLQKGSSVVKKRLREELKADECVILRAKEARWAQNPLLLKQVVDFLVGIKSPHADRLYEFIDAKMLVAMAYYWTPRDVGRQLVFDPNPEDTIRVVTVVLRSIQAWIQKTWTEEATASAPLNLVRIMEAGLVTTITTLLWALPDDSPVWKASVGCAFHLFRLEEQGVQERLAADWIVQRKRTGFTPATLDRYKGFINRPGVDQGLWCFMESLFLPAFKKRGLDFTQEIIAPPPMFTSMQKGGSTTGGQSAAVSGDNQATKHCHYCKKAGSSLMRCGKCKKVYFCDRVCQTRDWNSHKLECK